MAKKPSMPDFTFALGADLREAAAKMREMSQPPKHQSALQSEDPVDAISDETQEIIEESATLESLGTTEPLPGTSPSVDLPIEPEPLSMDLPHGEEVSSATGEPSEEKAGPIDAIKYAEDIVQPLDGTDVKGDTPEVSPRCIETEGLGRHEEGGPQESLSAISAAQEEYLEPLQSPPSESCPENSQTAAYTPEADPASPLSDAQAEPTYTVQAAVLGTADTIHITKQSVIVNDSPKRKMATNDSRERSHAVSVQKDTLQTVRNRQQQTLNSSDLTSTDNDTYTPNIFCTETHSPLVKEPAVVTAASSHSLYSQLAYGQPQTVTDYQIHSTSLNVSPNHYGHASTLPKNPFQNRAVAPDEASFTLVPPKNDGHELSQTVIKATDSDKQPVDSKGFYTKQPAAVQVNAPQGLSPSIVAATLQDAHLGGARQVLLDALTALRQQSPQVVVNLKRLAPAIGLSYGTVRNTISRLVREGVICTTQVRTGDAHGVCVEFIDDNPLPSMTASQRVRPSMTYQQQPQTVAESHEKRSSVPTDDTCIWNTDAELIAILWPFAADAGFGPSHLAQLRRAYQLQGWESENVSRCLRYLDWELANGVPAAHEHVAAWLRIMQRQGHYPRPEGYVDPEILRLRQQAEEERELAEARSRFK